jgi:hypothetical protein
MEVMTMTRNAVQFPPPRGLASLLLSGDQIGEELPEIKAYAKRPVFDENFVLCRPGWHAGSGILVHGPDIGVELYQPPDPNRPAIDRLPCHLRQLLGGFPFLNDADVANTLLALVTCVLTNLFIVAGKAVLLIDGNQPGLGKTWLGRCIGIVLDGADPCLVLYSANDEELSKHACATLRNRDQSMLLIDNAKTVGARGCIDSPFLEANSLAPMISWRILGKSENFTRPNDVLWCVTMNGTKATPDLVSRSYPVRLFHAGDLANRPIAGPNPLEYAREHRVEILGELASMVTYWNQQGRPNGPTSHRCATWARIAGGIVWAAGYPEVLSNLAEAATEFDSAQDELAALAEVVLRQRGPYFITNSIGGRA